MQVWDRIIPVGIMWGNDPDVKPNDQKDEDHPKELKESWINEEATALRKGLHGTRSNWGFGGRLNGPGIISTPIRQWLLIRPVVDNFVSACASCHSISEKNTKAPMFPPDDATEEEKMKWFRNIPAGEPFTPGDISGDYSLQ